MANAFVWDLDPVLIDFGPVQIRWYGLVFAVTLLAAFGLWRWQMRRGGHSADAANAFFVWGFLGVLIGARLGHCFFYHPVRYLQNPLEILYFWKGGLASHGATLGVVVALVLFALRYKLRILEAMDRLAMPAAVGAAGIRLGNFLNSEILGRPTDLPWAVIFARVDSIPRHPSQLYEFALGLGVLGLLLLLDRAFGRERRPLGLLAGGFLSAYFAGRFSVEFVKARHTLSPDSALTMGQYLSIAPFLVGAVLLIRALGRGATTGTKTSST